MEGGAEGTAWLEEHRVWGTRLCIVTPLLGTWAPLQSSLKWSVWLSASQIHVTTHQTDTAPGSRVWGGGQPHSNTGVSRPRIPQRQQLPQTPLDAFPHLSDAHNQNNGHDTCLLYAL